MSFRRGWIAVFLFTLIMINYTDRVALSVAAKPIAGEFGLSPVTMGYLLSSFTWTYILGLIPVGILVDRYGGKIVGGAGIGLWSAATVLTGVSTSWLFLGATRLVMGFGEATSFPSALRVIRDWIPSGERGMVMSIVGSGAAAGPGFGALVVAALIGLFDWRVGFFCVGAIGFVWLACWIRWFGPPEQVGWLAPAERAKILAERPPAAAPEDREPGSSMAGLLAQRSVWGLFFTHGCEAYGGYMLVAWLPSYLASVKHLDVVNAGFMTAVPFFAAMVLSILLGRISDRMLSGHAVGGGRRRLMIAALMIVSSVILLVPAVDNIWAIGTLIAISKSTGLSAASLNFSLTNDLVRHPRDIGRVGGIQTLGANLFGVTGPIVTGYVIAYTGRFDATFWIAGGLTLIGAVVAIVVTRAPIEYRPALQAQPLPV